MSTFSAKTILRGPKKTGDGKLTEHRQTNVAIAHYFPKLPVPLMVLHTNDYGHALVCRGILCEGVVQSCQIVNDVKPIILRPLPSDYFGRCEAAICRT